MKLRNDLNDTNAESVGIAGLFDLLRQHRGKRTESPREAILVAACRTFRHLATHQSVAHHSETPELVKELDVRRDRLPESNRPSGFSDRGAIYAYEDAFEAGYREWPKLNPYNRADCRRAWEIGYANGESAFQQQLAERRFSVAHSFGFYAGYEGVAKRNPYRVSRESVEQGQKRAAEAWHTGFSAGARAVAA